MTPSENNIVIKPLPLEDIPLAAETEAVSLGAEGWTADSIRETLALNGHYFAAYKNGNFAGHGGYTSVLDEGYITNIAVSPKFRRQGIGFKITEALIENAKSLKLSFLSLEVRESNTAAISLYKKLDFSVEGRRKNFYNDPKEDAIIMTLKF